MFRRIAIAVGAGAALLAGAAVLVGWLAWRELHAPMTVPADGLLFEVRSGMPLGRVTEALAERGLLDRPRLLKWYGRLDGTATRLHAGEYQLTPGTTPVEALAAFAAGEVYLHQLTIVEGWRFVDLVAVLEAHPAVAAAELDADEIMTELGSPGLHPEGQFLPDSYRFPKGTSAIDLLRLAHDALAARLETAWENRMPGLAVDTPYEALILASIIEKETALAAERRQISGVFHRRLERGMRLQTDPTVIYGLGEGFDGDLRRRDLASDTPYNTYTRRGLPPTPIALPSAASIEAAVAPDAGTALYFVATGDPDGSHAFSDSLEEHNAAVRAYLERVRAAGDR